MWLNSLFVNFLRNIFGVLLRLGLRFLEINSDFAIGYNILDFVIGSELEIINIFDRKFGVFGKLIFGNQFLMDKSLELVDFIGREDKFVLVEERVVLGGVEFDEVGFAFC